MAAETACCICTSRSVQALETLLAFVALALFSTSSTVYARAPAPEVAVYLRQDTDVLDLGWDSSSVNLVRQLTLLGLHPVEIQDVEPGAVLAALPPGSTYVVPAQNGNQHYSTVEDTEAVASFVSSGGLVILLDAKTGDGAPGRHFTSRALRYQGDWRTCRLLGDNNRGSLGAPRLSARGGRAFLPAVADDEMTPTNEYPAPPHITPARPPNGNASAAAAAASVSGTDGGGLEVGVVLDWPAELEDARVTHVHGWCLAEDDDSLTWPLYVLPEEDWGLRVAAQAFGKAGTPGAVVWLGYSWRDGPMPGWGQLLKKLITDFWAGRYAPPALGNTATHPLGPPGVAAPPAARAPFDSEEPGCRNSTSSAIESVLEASSNLAAEDTADIVRRLLDALPASYPPPSPSPTACSVCQDCLAAMAPVAAAALARPTPSASARAAVFLPRCLTAGFNASACNAVAGAILAGSSNLAARAGMLCASLGACNASTCASLAVPALNGSATLSGGLDLCAAEGVAGGAPTLLSSATRGWGECRFAADCDAVGAGMTCEAPSSNGNGNGSGNGNANGLVTQVCDCVAGRDVCYALGRCVAFCSLNSTVATLAALNAGADACDPASKARSQCAAGWACDAVPNCTRWQCNAGSQRLEQVPCSGRCVPQALEPVSARVSDDGTAVLLGLSTSAASLKLVPCGAVFDAVSVASLGGVTALCSAEGAALSARMTPSANLTAGARLTLLASGSLLVAQLNTSRAFSGSVTVQGCSACVSPSPVITGPATITQPCAGASGGLLAAATQPPAFDASLSFDPSGRAAWAQVRWSLPANAGARTSRSILQGAINRTNSLPSARDRLRLALTSEEASSLEDAANYILEVQVTSWLGTSASATISFAKASTSPAPIVSVVGQVPQTFRLNYGIKAAAEAGPVCSGKSLQWLWTARRGWAGLPAVGIPAQQFFLPAPLPAVHGQSIDLRVAASYAADDDASTAITDVTMLAVGSAPLAILTGPSGDLPDNTSIILNATASSDPDTTRLLQRLTFVWSCRREDFPAPCFPSSARGDWDAAPGVWTIPVGLLATDKHHTITVTVAKAVAAGAAPLEASASVTFRPRPAAQPFPEGTLTRQCAPAACGAPHPTDTPLTLLLTLATPYVNASVSWSSTELPAVSQLKAASAATGAALASGAHLLTIPSGSLPTNRGSLTVVATLALAGAAGQAAVTVPLNSAPTCGLAGGGATAAAADAAAACLVLEVLNDTFPAAAVAVRAQGWIDGQDAQLRYEFGVREYSSGGGAAVDTLHRIGSAPSATLVGLAAGVVTLYGCALDSQGARTCGAANVTVRPPAADFDAATAAATLNVTALAESHDVSALLQAGSSLANLLQFVVAAAAANTSSSPNTTSGSTGTRNATAVVEAVAQQAAAIAVAILESTSLADPEQAQQAISIIAGIADSASSVLPESARIMLAGAAVAAAAKAAALPSSASDGYLARICRLLGASMPQRAASVAAAANDTTTSPGGSITNANAGQSAGRRRLSFDLASVWDTTALVTASSAQERLTDLLNATDMISGVLGQRAVPGAGYVSAGGSGVYVGTVALLTPPAGASASTAIQAHVSAGPGATGHAAASATAVTTTAAAAKLATETKLASAAAAAEAPGAAATDKTATKAAVAAAAAVARRLQLRRALQGVARAGGDGRRPAGVRVLQGSASAATVAVSTDGEADLVLIGSTAAAADGYVFDLQYTPAAAYALSVALSSELPASVNLLPSAGLTTVTWNTVSGAASVPPALDGASSYVLLQIPAPGYDASKATACLTYDAATGAVTGGLRELLSGTAPAAFVAYDAAKGTVQCRVSAMGSYVVAQQSALSLQPSGVSNPEDGQASTSADVSPKLLASASAVGGVALALLIALAVFVAVLRRRRRLVGVMPTDAVHVVRFGDRRPPVVAWASISGENPLASPAAAAAAAVAAGPPSDALTEPLMPPVVTAAAEAEVERRAEAEAEAEAAAQPRQRPRPPVIAIDSRTMMDVGSSMDAASAAGGDADASDREGEVAMLVTPPTVALAAAAPSVRVMSRFPTVSVKVQSRSALSASPLGPRPAGQELDAVGPRWGSRPTSGNRTIRVHSNRVLPTTRARGWAWPPNVSGKAVPSPPKPVLPASPTRTAAAISPTKPVGPGSGVRSVGPASPTRRPAPASPTTRRDGPPSSPTGQAAPLWSPME